jgi:hypothetical protein
MSEVDRINLVMSCHAAANYSTCRGGILKKPANHRAYVSTVNHTSQVDQNVRTIADAFGIDREAQLPAMGRRPG